MWGVHHKSQTVLHKISVLSFGIDSTSILEEMKENYRERPRLNRRLSQPLRLEYYRRTHITLLVCLIFSIGWFLILSFEMFEPQLMSFSNEESSKRAETKDDIIEGLAFADETIQSIAATNPDSLRYLRQSKQLQGTDHKPKSLRQYFFEKEKVFDGDESLGEEATPLLPQDRSLARLRGKAPVAEPSAISKAFRDGLSDTEPHQTVFVAIQMPLQFSHPRRFKNIEHLKKAIHDLVIVDGLHGNDPESSQELLKASQALSLRIDPGYFSGSETSVHFGKLGIYATFLSIFQQVLTIQSEHEIECLAVIEDDYVLARSEVSVIEEECKRLKQEAEVAKSTGERVIFERFAKSNALNLYLVSELPVILDSVRRTGVTDPFDIYTQKKRWLIHYRSSLTSFRINLPSTLTTQKRVSISSWNRCIDQDHADISLSSSAQRSKMSCNLETVPP